MVRCNKCGAEWCLDHQLNPLVCFKCGDSGHE
jgi:predicted  nucleic acid-binding Zn ribbon protein